MKTEIEKKQEDKRKYTRGGLIKDSNDLARQEFIFFEHCNRPIHCGWFMAWHIRYAQDLIKNRKLFHAVKKRRRKMSEETIADIVAEKRARANEIESAAGCNANQFQRELIADLRAEADRIEESAAMREALVSIRDRVLSGGFDAISPSDIVNICDAALAAPARNCDVGTPEEQWTRIRAFCKRHKTGLRCVDCPVDGNTPKNCALIWAQMPYKEGGAK